MHLTNIIVCKNSFHNQRVLSFPPLPMLGRRVAKTTKKENQQSHFTDKGSSGWIFANSSPHNCCSSIGKLHQYYSGHVGSPDLQIATVSLSGVSEANMIQWTFPALSPLIPGFLSLPHLQIKYYGALPYFHSKQVLFTHWTNASCGAKLWL